MAPRSYFDWLKETHTKPHWIVVTDMTGKRLEHRKLEIGTDLKRVLIENLARWTNDGWSVEEFGSKSSMFFCNRGSERRSIAIQPTDPTTFNSNSFGPSTHHGPALGSNPPNNITPFRR
jgi:hypothetical protein